MREIHLIVLWEFALPAAARILDDIRRNFEILHDGMSTWPDDPLSCFRRFYGANLVDAGGKVRFCGGGAFRFFIVRDNSPVYGLRETSRGLEHVNLNLFDAKMRYRDWTGGGHKVHTTNSTAEAARDIFLLTGHPANSWENRRPAGNLTVLPGQTGWKSLREIFSFLNTTMPYVVLRNAESLPDGFDPSVHGDIDLLVPDAEACASLLNARKIFPESHRVHYEIAVGGQPIRFDFRFVGDDYYDRRWERRMLERRICRDGVSLLAPEDAFFALVYHALYQKFEIADDYVRKASALAAAAGRAWTGFDDALLQLEEFLARNGYEKTRPNDSSVRWNEKTVHWRQLAEEICSLSGTTDIRPYLLEAVREQTPLKSFFFSGTFDTRPCFIKYTQCAPALAATEWRCLLELSKGELAELFVRPFFWHKTGDGGAFVILERLDGRTLGKLIADRSPRLETQAATLVADLEKITNELERVRLVHRDIRPDNLIVADDGHVKLIDFQFAKSRDDRREDAFVVSHPRILHALGGEFAIAPGKWNDRHSVCECLRLLPPSPVRDAAIERMPEPSDGTCLTAELTRRTRKKLRHRAFRLEFKKLRRLLCGSRLSDKELEDLAFATYALREWS